AAPEVVPAVLFEQLTPNGRLIAPVGPRAVQELRVYTRTEQGFEFQALGAVSFVPFTSGTTQR
ncbi:MAG: protein-L-isoaspartate O-methyltransferase family protein, partial [Gammaproteobacteria bacterium]